MDSQHAEELAREHLADDHFIIDADDLPPYVDGTFTPVEVLAMMARRKDCTHDLQAIYEAAT